MGQFFALAVFVSLQVSAVCGSRGKGPVSPTLCSEKSSIDRTSAQNGPFNDKVDRAIVPFADAESKAATARIYELLDSDREFPTELLPHIHIDMLISDGSRVTKMLHQLSEDQLAMLDKDVREMFLKYYFDGQSKVPENPDESLAAAYFAEEPHTPHLEDGMAELAVHDSTDHDDMVEDPVGVSITIIPAEELNERPPMDGAEESVDIVATRPLTPEERTQRYIECLTTAETARLKPEEFLNLARHLSCFNYPELIPPKCRQALYSRISYGNIEAAVLGQLPLEWLQMDPQKLVNALTCIPKRFHELNIPFLSELVASHPGVCQNMVPALLKDFSRGHLAAVTPMCIAHMPDKPSFPLDLFPDEFFAKYNGWLPTNAIKAMTAGQIGLFGSQLNDLTGDNFDLTVVSRERFSNVPINCIRGFLIGQYSTDTTVPAKFKLNKERRLGDLWNYVAPKNMRSLIEQADCLRFINVDDIYAMKVEYQRLFLGSERTIKAVSANWEDNMWFPKLSLKLTVSSEQYSWVDTHIPIVAAQMARFGGRRVPRTVPLDNLFHDYLGTVEELWEYLDQSDHLGPSEFKPPLRPFIICALMLHGRRKDKFTYLLQLTMAIGPSRQHRTCKLHKLLSALPQLKDLDRLLVSLFKAQLDKAPRPQETPDEYCRCLSCRPSNDPNADAGANSNADADVNSNLDSGMDTDAKEDAVVDEELLTFCKQLPSFKQFVKNPMKIADLLPEPREAVLAMLDTCIKALEEDNSDDFPGFSKYVKVLRSATSGTPRDSNFRAVFEHIIGAGAKYAVVAMALLDTTKIKVLDHLNDYISALERTLPTSAINV